MSPRPPFVLLLASIFLGSTSERACAAPVILPAEFCCFGREVAPSEVRYAEAVVLARFPRGEQTSHIVRVLRGPELVADLRLLEMPKNLGPDFEGLCFVCLNRLGTFNLYGRGIPCSPAMDAYVYKVLELPAIRLEQDVPGKPPSPPYKVSAEELRVYLEFIGHGNRHIADDAFDRLKYACYLDLPGTAQQIPRERIIRWLRHPRTAPRSANLYAQLLGYVGLPADAGLLEEWLESDAVAGALVGMTRLDRARGWCETVRLMNAIDLGPGARLGALQAVEVYLCDGLVDPFEVSTTAALLLDDPDLLDRAIEFFARWRRLEQADAIFDAAARQTNFHHRLKDALVCFSLECPKHPRAERFLVLMRLADPELVARIEAARARQQPSLNYQ